MRSPQDRGSDSDHQRDGEVPFELGDWHGCDPETGRLLHFMMPGVLHRLGNALFAMRGAAHSLGQTGTSPAASRALLDDAVDGAAQVFDLVRSVCRIDGAAAACESGALLSRIIEILRVPMRERGVRIRPDDASCAARQLVETVPMTRAVCGVAFAMSRALPPGSDVTLEVSTAPDAPLAEFDFKVVPHAGCLPFPLDGAAVAARLGAWLDPSIAVIGATHSVTLRCLRRPQI